MHARHDHDRSAPHDFKTADHQNTDATRDWILNATDDTEESDDEFEDMLRNDSIGG